VTKWYLPHELPTDVQLMLSGDSISARPAADLVRQVAAALQTEPAATTDAGIGIGRGPGSRGRAHGGWEAA
jgi:hypothetical protein